MSKHRRCLECGGTMTVRLETRRYGRGVDVVLKDVEVRHCNECGEEHVVIPRIEELHRLIASTLAQKKGRLLPGEIRFLRTCLGYSSRDFADFVGVRPETVSRWESERAGVSPSRAAEKLLRLAVLTEKPVEDYGLRDLDFDLGRTESLPRFSTGEDGWVASV